MNLENQIGTPTYQTITDFIDTTSSVGWTSGGTISNAAAGTFDVSAGTGYIRDAVSNTASIFSFDWAANNGIAIADGQVLGVRVDYNGGSPVINTVDVTTPAPFVNGKTTFLLGLIMREGTDYTFQNFQTQRADLGFLSNAFASGAFKKPRNNDVGLLLSETGTRNLALSTGGVWVGLNLITIPAFDSAVADTFDTYYTTDSGTTWVRGTGQTQWDNAQYNDITSGLVSFGNNNYGVHWVYMNLDGTMTFLYGQEEFNLQAQAEAVAVPATLPPKLQMPLLLKLNPFMEPPSQAQPL
jgi:hypothetical protein